MKKYPENIKFKYPWRTYQKRVLDTLNNLLEDSHLHIVAPPGSGKTVLGLEVILRLNQPTLVLAPTLTIRDQWIQRFIELFLQTNEKPDWISNNIKEPKLLTVITYQSLYSVFSEKKNNDEQVKTKAKVLNLLKKTGIKTLVFDEAHHLKNAWWKALFELKNNLDTTCIGLTATPPYDVTATEWRNYINLNGPIDAEIYVPELVKEKNLCPHQDYIYFSVPSKNEGKRLMDRHKKINDLYNELTTDETIINTFKTLDFIVNPLENLEWIYTNLEVYIAILVYLKNASITIEPEHFKVIGDKKYTIPSMDYSFLEKVLNYYLFTEDLISDEYLVHQEKLIGKLKHAGVLATSKVEFKLNNHITRLLHRSISKLESIKEIVDLEYKSLQDKLRMVIMTDYIRKEYLVNKKTNDLELDKIGVIPIFEKLRRQNNDKIRIAVLSGSIIIIHSDILEKLKTKAKKLGFDGIKTSALTYDDNYVKVSSSKKNNLVYLITEIFQDGDIDVLIGTTSLLGEGWDAPSINTLILASSVGSFVLSNQMRGRAIRTDLKNKEKVANIWHLVTIDPYSADNGTDYNILKRRFDTFVGVSFGNIERIESGLNRMGIPSDIREADIKILNKKMIIEAENREKVRLKWLNSLGRGKIINKEIKIPIDKKKYYKIKKLYYTATLRNLSILISSSFAWFFFDAILGLIKNLLNLNVKALYFFLISFILGSIFYFGKITWKYFVMYISYRDISKDIENLGKALLSSLQYLGEISNNENIRVTAYLDELGAIYCYLNNAEVYEQTVFIKSLNEILQPIENPRYLIVRKNFKLKLIQQIDYHAVPEKLSYNKKYAEYFEIDWKKYVGDCQLIYTRNLEGRKLLLKAKAQSLSAKLKEANEITKTWN